MFRISAVTFNIEELKKKSVARLDLKLISDNGAGCCLRAGLRAGFRGILRSSSYLLSLKFLCVELPPSPLPFQSEPCWPSDSEMQCPFTPVAIISVTTLVSSHVSSRQPWACLKDLFADRRRPLKINQCSNLFSLCSVPSMFFYRIYLLKVILNAYSSSTPTAPNGFFIKLNQKNWGTFL